ncbi:MAG: hypothetical protein KatS3mg067_0264 [Thermosynechococcus sp.]|uniref:hypothetical protein n=1 Tax=Thermosynechococcus sp. TaxID=2814275 RepID=UPI0022073532|nr:hypothetical protein [Thermosynechococcus sp.]BCX11326.1 MAG: hypothetical protein KatS3mg067_0264 [Thermosynechococcus sp.]
MPQPLSVAVFIGLEWHPDAGGHVKCWERFAEAASHYLDRVDLTLYFLGAKQQTLAVGANVRYQLLPPQCSTHSLEIMRQGAGMTDVAPFHWGLRRYLPQHQVFHITDTFSFAQTVRRFCRQQRRPLLSSIHTDLPLLTRTYSREIIWRMSGRSWGAAILAVAMAEATTSGSVVWLPSRTKTSGLYAGQRSRAGLAAAGCRLAAHVFAP